MKDSEIKEEEGRARAILEERRMDPIVGELGLSPSLQAALPKGCELKPGELPTMNGGKATDASDEHAMASPRMIPIPESPSRSGEPKFSSVVNDTGNTSPSFDKQRAPSQAPERVSGNYDYLSYDQVRDLCKARGYHKKDAKAVLKTRLEAMDAVERHSMKQTENDMDISPSVLRKRNRPVEDGSVLEPTQQEVAGKRSRGDTPSTTMEVDPAVAQAHAQGWSPELKPKLEMEPICVD